MSNSESHDTWEIVSACSEGRLDPLIAALKSGWDADEADSQGRFALCEAAKGGHLEIVDLLLEAEVTIDRRETLYATDQKTPLAAAAEAGHLDVVETLLAHQASPDLCTSIGDPPLLKAVENGHVAIAERLLDHGAPIDQVGYFQMRTPLMAACHSGQEACVHLLLERGADPSVIAPRGGETALHYGSTPEIVEQLLAAKAPVDVPSTESGETPLFDAARWHSAHIVRLLLEAGADPNVRSEAGEVPLHGACRYSRCSEVTASLIEAGAGVDERSNEDETPLIIACRSDSAPAETVAVLVAAGAQLEAKNRSGTTPLLAASSSLNEPQALHDKVCILLDAGADPNCRSESGSTPLERLARRGQVDTCRRLLAAGAKVDAVDKWGRTALHWAAHDGLADVAELLLEAKADPNLPDENGNVPLHYACREDQLEVVSVLLSHSADVTIKNHKGREPLNYLPREFREQLAATYEDKAQWLGLLDVEDHSHLACQHVATVGAEGDHCPTCGWSAEGDPAEPTIHCPWCRMFALVISDYEVLQGNPEIPTANTEVAFTYTCGHCGSSYRNGWNAMTTDRPTLFELRTDSYWESEDSGRTWRRRWGLDD